MKLLFSFIFTLIVGHGVAQQADTSAIHAIVPIIKWDIDTFDLGIVKRGETRELIYNFTNVGKADLLIDLVTACRCTSLNWPSVAIAPGESGKIEVIYDSTGQKLGPFTKTIDVIANTEPIVVEAFFMVDVIE